MNKAYEFGNKYIIVIDHLSSVSTVVVCIRLHNQRGKEGDSELDCVIYI